MRGSISITVTVGAEAGEHRRELDADGAGADHDQALRDLLELQDVVRGEDRLAVRGDARAALFGREPVASMTFFVSTFVSPPLALHHDRLRRPRAGPGP